MIASRKNNGLLIIKASSFICLMKSLRVTSLWESLRNRYTSRFQRSCRCGGNLLCSDCNNSRLHSVVLPTALIDVWNLIRKFSNFVKEATSMDFNRGQFASCFMYSTAILNNSHTSPLVTALLFCNNHFVEGRYTILLTH